jgi:hypothetical protein
MVNNEETKSKPSNRDNNGRLLKGFSANPKGKNGGRPKLPDFFKAGGPDAMRHLLGVANGTIAASGDIRMRACTIVMERIYGKAPLRKSQAPLDGDGQRTFTKTEVAVFLLQAYEAGQYALGLDVNDIIEGAK